jgi:hypothetical protein
MPGFSKSPLAFGDCRAMLDRALQSTHGIQVRCANHGEAVSLRSRLNSLRRVDRLENKRIYQPDDYMYGNSAYDALVIRILKRGEPDDHVVFIEPRAAKAWDIHEIPAPKPPPPPDLDTLMRELTSQDETDLLLPPKLEDEKPE